MLLMLAVLPAFAGVSQAGRLIVVYPDRLGIREDQTFPFAVLKLAMQKSGVDHELKPSEHPMNDERVRASLDNETVDVAWFGTSSSFEQQYLPVRIPITRGILGYRLFIIRGEDQPAFSKVSTLDDLKKFTCIQGKGWADAQILAASGLTVRTAAVFDQLFERVKFKRVDFFPLGANEIFDLLSSYKARMPSLDIEKSLVLVYPFDFFFFVKKGNRRLHDILYAGLTAAQKDGSYDRLFQTHPEHKVFFGKADIQHRRVIRIENPLLSDETRRLFAQMSTPF